MLANYSKKEIISTITTYLENNGELKVYGEIGYTTKQLDDWYLSITNINDKLSLLVSYKQEILLSVNFPVYIPPIDSYTLAVDITTDYNKWFSLLQQKMITTSREEVLNSITNMDLYRYGL